MFSFDFFSFNMRVRWLGNPSFRNAKYKGFLMSVISLVKESKFHCQRRIVLVSPAVLLEKWCFIQDVIVLHIRFKFSWVD